MIQHAWSVICEKAIIDRDTNNISLDVVEQFNFGLLPIPDNADGIVVPVQLEVVSLWYRDNPEEPDRTRAVIDIIGPDDRVLGNSEFDIDLSAFQRLRTRTRIGSLPIPRSHQSGRYIFVVKILRNDQWMTVARLPLEVIVTETTADRTELLARC